MKVLMAAPYDSNGRFKGGIMYIANSLFSEFLKNKEKNIDLIKFETCRVERSNSSIAKINFENLNNFKFLLRDLVVAVQFHNPRVIYFHSSKKLALLKDILTLRRAKKKTGIKSILHIHCAEYKEIMFKNILLNKLVIRLLNKYVDKIIFLSKNTAEEFILNGLIRRKIEIVYNFHTLDNKIEKINKKITNISKKTVTDLIFMGSIDEKKGIFDLLETLIEIDGNYKLHICGDFVDERTKKKFYEFINIMTDKIVFHGYVSGTEKADLLDSSDVLILPSYTEGLPIVIMEAFGSGCSVITTNVGAIPEIFKEECGYIIEAGDKKHLKSSIIAALNNKEQGAEQMLFNYNYSKDFQIGNFKRKIEKICQEII